MWDVDISILSELIAHDARIQPILGEYGKQSIILTENENISYQITFKSVPQHIFVLKSDKFPPPKEIFCGSKQECKRSDYIILCEKSKEKRAIFVEVKLGDDDNKSIVCQLKGSVAIFKYCQNIGRFFWDKEDFLKEYKFSFVAIKNIPAPRLKKTTTRYRPNKRLSDSYPTKSSSGDIPETMAIFRFQSELYFDKFLQEIEV